MHKSSKNSCIHLRLEDSQTRRHPALRSPLPTCVEQSVRSDGLPPILLNDKSSSPEPHRSKSNYVSPSPKPPLFHAGGRTTAQSSSVPGPHRAKTHSRCPETHSPLRVQTSLLPGDLSPCFAPFHSALSQVKSDQCCEGKNGQSTKKMSNGWTE